MLFNRVLAMALAAAGFFVSPSPAVAQGLEEVVVTARKLDETLFGVPIAVSDYSGGAVQKIRTSVPEELVPAEIVSRFEAQLILREFVQRGLYDQAVLVGERLVELTETEFGERSIPAAQSLAELAEIQRQAGEHEASERNFLATIGTFTDEEGIFSEQLIGPLIGLACNYRDVGDDIAALAAYNEAHALNRRVFGLLNTGQIDILDGMTESLMSMNQFAEAREHQLTALQLAERNHGADSLELVPALYKYAHWLRSHHNYGEERTQYLQAIKIVEREYGKESPHLVFPLRETANSFRAQQTENGLGTGSLKRALSILEAQEAEDRLALAETLRDLGDWSVAFRKVRTDAAEYLRAWELLGELESGEALRRAWFAEPDYVLYQQPSERGIVSNGSESGVRSGFVRVVFDVNERGRTENVVVVESDPPGMKDDSVAQAIRQSRFRPRMVNGEIVRAEKVERRFDFFFKSENDSPD